MKKLLAVSILFPLGVVVLFYFIGRLTMPENQNGGLLPGVIIGGYYAIRIAALFMGLDKPE